ncbi:hypothetical protein J3A83DRAFT_4190278 [Scleroderma citrinum]
MCNQYTPILMLSVGQACKTKAVSLEAKFSALPSPSLCNNLTADVNPWCITISWPLNAVVEDYVTSSKLQEERAELWCWAVLHKNVLGKVDELESKIAIVKQDLEASNQQHEAHVFKPQDSPTTHPIPTLITFDSEDELIAINLHERTSLDISPSIAGLFTLQGDPPSNLFDMSRPPSPQYFTSVLPIITLIPADVDTHTTIESHLESGGSQLEGRETAMDMS